MQTGTMETFSNLTTMAVWVNTTENIVSHNTVLSQMGQINYGIQMETGTMETFSNLTTMAASLKMNVTTENMVSPYTSLSTQPKLKYNVKEVK